jgi:colanic acid biosynthesis glycosyl transferase WcaI
LRFLLINRFFGDQQTPTGRMLWDVAMALQQQGHEVEVLASKSKYAGSSGVSGREATQFKVRQVRELGRGRIASWASFWLSTLFSLSSRRWDRCLLLTDPPFLPFAAWLTQIFRSPKQQLYWWTMDLYPEALVAAEMAREKGLLSRGLRSLNELGLRQMSGVVALGQRQLGRLQTYRQWHAVAADMVVVPPWDLRPIPRVMASTNRVLKRLSCPGKKLALYTGNLGEGHMFEQFVDAARWLHGQTRADWIFVFVVRGSGRPVLESVSAALPNIRILDYLPEAETPDLLWSANVHLVSMKPGWEGVIVPSKLYGALQTNTPILFLGPLTADTSTEIERMGRGISLPTTATGEEVVRALDKLAEPAWLREPHLDTAAPRHVAEFITRP